MVLNYAALAPPVLEAIARGVCALEQEGRAGQLVLEICPMPRGSCPLLRWGGC